MTIFQKPNKSSLISLFGFLIAFPASGVLEDAAIVIAIISGIIWSYQETTSGVNKFRKTLGISGLIVIAVFLFLRLK